MYAARVRGPEEGERELLKPSEVLKIESAIQKSDLRMSFKTSIHRDEI